MSSYEQPIDCMSPAGTGRLLEQSLAWDLADAARPLLNPRSRMPIYVALGAGDIRDAIARLLVLCTARGHVPPDELVTRIGAWLDCFVGDIEEPKLRRLLHEASAAQFVATTTNFVPCVQVSS